MIWPLFYSATLVRQQLRWTTVEAVSADPVWLDAPPQMGTHLLYELQLRNAQAAVAVNINIEVNADYTAGNYHFQRYLTLNAAAAATESTTQNGGQVPGSTTVAGVYGSWFIIFPWFRTPARQKAWIGAFSLEEAALAQDCCIYTQKRQGAGVSGSLVDPITSVRISHGSGTATDGTIRRAVVA